MSRVIKAAIWEENPHLIDVPAPSVPSSADGMEDGVSEETVQFLLSRIEEREHAIDVRSEELDMEIAVRRGEIEQEREQLLSEAKEQIEKEREEARQAGHDEGFAAGREAGLRDAHDAMRDYLMQAEDVIVSIAMTAVERVLPQHFIDVPQMVLPIVRDAIERVKDQKEIVVHVPPDSYDFVLMARDELRGIVTAGDSSLSITSDESLKPGDCLVETPNGSVDARLQTQIEQLKKAVREVML